MTPSPALLAALMRSRFMVRRARATAGIGERRSRTRGSGMEFEDYGQYQPGDDTRHLDAHLHARTGQYYVRQYAAYQQLDITIIVDGSASMNFGTPTKFEFGCGLASALAFVALAGGDVVRIGVHRHGGVAWSPRARGAARYRTIVDWLAMHQPSGSGFGRALRQTLPQLSGRGLVIVLSDWWDDDLNAGFDIFGSLQQEIFAVHILSPQELEPASPDAGEVRLIDSENQHEVELSLDRGVLNGYRRALADWQTRLRREVARRLGRYLPVRSDAKLDQVMLSDWRQLGLIG
jgi:uncharacterized protein (DUF58 family)